MRRAVVVAGACFLLVAEAALAQEHWAEGPVWEDFSSSAR